MIEGWAPSHIACAARRVGAHLLVRVTETPEGWHVVNVAAASAAVVPIRSRADDMAERIVRIAVL